MPLRGTLQFLLRVHPCCGGTCTQVWVRGQAVQWENLSWLDSLVAGNRRV